MNEDRRRQLLPGREEDRRPVDRVEPDDPLADHVQPLVALAPPVAVVLAAGVTPERGDVVGERIEPDVDHLLGIVRHRDAPAPCPLARAGDAEVAEAVPDEHEHLVAPVLGLDPKAPVLDQIEQHVLVVRQPEEPVELDDYLGRLSVLGAAPAGEISGRDERLAARAVEALVVALVEIPPRRRHARAARRRGDAAGRCSSG